jgi:hypothetical protein
VSPYALGDVYHVAGNDRKGIAMLMIRKKNVLAIEMKAYFAKESLNQP